MLLQLMVLLVDAPDMEVLWRQLQSTASRRRRLAGQTSSEHRGVGQMAERACTLTKRAAADDPSGERRLHGDEVRARVRLLLRRLRLCLRLTVVS
jgi:hypothetical protein